jgi:hypothetical protein
MARGEPVRGLHLPPPGVVARLVIEHWLALPAKARAAG